MKLRRKKLDETSATITHTLGLIWACSALFVLTAYASDPSWWSSLGTGSQPAVVSTPQVTTNSTTGVVTTDYAPNDYAVVTQGQFKQFTARAVDFLNTDLTGGAGTNLNTMVSNWAQDYATNGYNATNIKPSDYTVMNVGQLKYIGSLIWTNLITAGYTNSPPAWLATTNAADYSAANLGQLKTVFNFDFIGAPASVTGLTASATNPDEIDLSWTLPAINNANAILIQQSTDGGTNWATVATLDARATSYALGNLDPTQTYTFRVNSGNGAGASSSSSSSPTQPTPPIPPSPSGLTGVLDSSGNMDLSWTASTGAVSYNIDREKLATGVWTASYATSTGASSSYTDSGYGTGGYHYRVSAVNPTGPSAPSNEFPVSRYAVIDLGSNNIPTSLNNNGDVVGNNSSGGFVWHQGALTNLATTISPPWVINDRYYLGDEFEISTSKFSFHPTFSGRASATDINDSGAIVGSIYQYIPPTTDPNYEANLATAQAAAVAAGVDLSTDPVDILGGIDDGSSMEYLTEGVYWSQGSAAPVLLPDPYNAGLGPPAPDASGPGGWPYDNSDDDPAVQISNANSIRGLGEYYPVQDEQNDGYGFWWSSPSVQPIPPYQSGGVYANVECMNRTGDTVLDWWSSDSGQTVQGLLKQGESTPTPILTSYNSANPYALEPVIAFSDSAPYIYVCRTFLYDGSNDQYVALVYFTSASISTPSDPNQVQVIGMSGNYPVLLEKAVSPGSAPGTLPTWIPNPLYLADLLAPNTGFQLQSVVKINNNGAIVGTATYSGTNTAIAAGSHGVLLAPAYRIQVSDFIPQQWLSDPPRYVYVGNAPRKTPIDGSFTSGTATFFQTSDPSQIKMQQTVMATVLANVDPGGTQESYTLNTIIGPTKKFYSAAVPGGTSTKINTLSPTATPFATQTATPILNNVTITHPSNNVVTVELECEAKDPLANPGAPEIETPNPAPPIYYDITVKIDATTTPPTYTLSGNHKNFPACAVYINNQLVHDYSPIPGGYTPYVLGVEDYGPALSDPSITGGCAAHPSLTGTITNTP